MKEIQAFIDSKAALLAMFNIEGSFYDIEIEVDTKWRRFGFDSMEYGFENREFQYSIEIYGTSVWESKCGGYEIAVGDDGCGNRYAVIVNKSLELTEEDELYAFDD